MKNTTIKVLIFSLIVGFLIIVSQVNSSVFALNTPDVYLNLQRFYPTVPPEAYKFSLYHDAPFKVAMVFGRAAGCQDATPDLITSVSNTAVGSGLDPEIAASVIAVESGCNPLAVSGRGALGLMQVMVPVWKTKYDFSDLNLLNSDENIHVGTSILAQLIDTYGLAEGIKRYNGLGEGCSSCDPNYTAKILSLARQGEK